MIHYLKTYFVAKDLRKHNNAISLISLNIILFHAFSLNVWEYLKYHQQQYYHKQLKNHGHIQIIYFFILSTEKSFET